MKNHFLILALFALFFSACQTPETPVEEESTEAEAALVELSSEGELVPLMLEASFMSTQQTFSYSFFYDANLMELTEEVLTGGSTRGANFKVQGGTEITASTMWLSQLDMVPELAASQLYGRYQVYRYSLKDGLCTLDKAVVQHAEEGLVFQLRTCPDQDRALGEEALESLLTGLRLKDIE